MSVKISELPILDSLADNDVIAGVDVSGNITSKIEMATLKNYIDTNTQYTAGTNIDITNNVVSAPNVYNKTETDGLIDDLETNINEQLEEKDEQIEELQSEVDSLSTIFNAFPTESGEGESLTLDDTAEVKFKKFDLKGNTSQEGTPTPSSPIPVNVVSGDNEINVCGKNLIGLGTILHAYRDNSTGKIQINDNCVGYYFPTSVLPDTITFSCVGGNRANISYYNSVPANAVQSVDYSNTNTLPRTISVNKTYSYIFIQLSYNTLDVTDIQFEKGSSATTYEPYQGNTYNIDLPEGMELCKIGNYQDYFYKDSGKWYLHKEIERVVLNGSESVWAKSGASTESVFVASLGLNYENITSKGGTRDQWLTNYFHIGTLGTENTFLAYNEDTTWGYRNLGFSISASLVNDIGTWKTWLSNNNISVYYPLQTPTNTEITYQPLIDQLNLLEKAMSKDSQTNISQVNNDLGFIIYAEAIKSLENVLDRIELLES